MSEITNQAVVQHLPGSTSTNNLPKLNGKNYQSWKELVEIVLKLRGLIKALTDDAADEITDLQAKLVLLETMDESHRAQVRGCKTAKEIITRLQLVYADNSAANIYRMLHKYYRYSKLPTDSISEHIGKVDEMRNQLADLGQKQSEEVYQVTLIGSLPAEYGSIMEVWELTHKEMRTTPNLVARLLKKEEDMKSSESSSHALAMNHGKHSGKNRHYEFKQSEPRSSDHRTPEQRQADYKSIEEKKKVSTCAACKQVGHWHRECPNKREADGFVPQRQQVRNSSNLVREEINFNVGNAKVDLSGQWILDSGATSHMANNENWFSELVRYATPESCAAGDGYGLEVLGKGKVKLEAEVGEETVLITLNDVLFIPQLAANLISVGAAADQGISTRFESKECTMLAGSRVVAKGVRFSERLYLMKVESQLKDMVMMARGAETLTDYHRRLGHVSIDRIKVLLKQLGMRIPEDSLEKCPSCPEGSGQHATHPEVGRITSEPGVIHVDLAVVNNKVSLEGHKYYLVCKDESSEFCLVYPCKTKTEVPTLMAKMLIDFEILSGKTVREIHSDNGSEFVNKVTDALWLKEGIRHFTSAPYCPQQNGMAEREVRSITNMARTMLLASSLPKELWSEAVQCAAYIKNRLPTSRCEVTPYERLTGRQPYIKHVVEFGCPVHVLTNSEYLTKWDARTEQGFVVGFTERRNTYRVFIPLRSKVIRSCDVIFASHNSPILNERSVTESQTVRIEGVTTGTQSPARQSPARQSCQRAHESNQWNEGLSESGQYVTSKENPPMMNSTWLPEVETQGRPLVTGERLDMFFENYLKHDSMTATAPTLEETESVTSPEIEELTPNRNGTGNTTAESESRENESRENEDKSVPDPPARSTSLSKVLIVSEPKFVDEPSSYESAVSGPNKANWKEAIAAELEAHAENRTWEVVDRPDRGVSLSTKWVFTLKRDAIGKIERFKARLVARGFEQRQGVDYFETFSPVVSVKSIRTILALSAINHWHIVQFDVSTAFLNGKVDEDIYIESPEGVETENSKCLKLNKALYGLKQAPRAWNSMFDSLLRELGFEPTISDPCVYRGEGMIIVVYVDDGLVIGEEKEKCERVVEKLNERVAVKMLSGNYFLGIEIRQGNGSIRLSQSRYALETVKRFNLESSNSVSTPIVDVVGLSKLQNRPITTRAPYREAIGCLQYLASRTRPDILFAVNFLSRFNNAPCEEHWVAVKRLLKYVKGTHDLGIEYRDTRSGVEIDVYTDADWATDLEARHSKTGMMMLIGGGPVAFKSSYQDDIAQSSTEAEYIAANTGAREIKATTQFLDELGIKYKQPNLLIDNQSAVKQIQNLDTRERSRHVDLRYHYIRHLYSKKLFNIKSVPTEDQIADHLTKALNGPRLQKLNKASNLVSDKMVTSNSQKKATGAMAHLTLFCLMSLLCSIQSEARYFTTTETLLWRPTEYRVSHGVQIGSFDLVLTSVCDLAYTTADESTYGVQSKMYARLREKCDKSYGEIIYPVWNELASCLAEQNKGRSRRVKRFEPITMAVVTTGAAAIGGGCAIYSWLDPNSSSNRLDRVEEADKQRDKKLQEMKDELIAIRRDIMEARGVRDQLIDQLNASSIKMESNRMAIIHLSEISPHVAWDASLMLQKIYSDRGHLLDIVRSCRKGHFNTQALYEMGIKQLRDIDENDTHLEEVRLLPGQLKVSMKYLLKIESADTKVYQTVPFNHWFNYTEPNPVFLKYVGPKFLIHNTTSDCTKGVEEPPYHRVYTSCTETGFRDPSITSWIPAEKEEIEKLSRPQMYQTETENHIYCLYHNIRIGDKEFVCPPYPFVLPISTPFDLAGNSHRVQFSTLRLQETLAQPVGITLSSKTDEDFSREGELIRKIRIRNENSVQSGRLGFEKDTLTVPIDALIIGLGVATGTLIVVICITMCPCRGKNQPSTGTAQPVHSEQINIYAQPQLPPLPPQHAYGYGKSGVSLTTLPQEQVAYYPSRRVTDCSYSKVSSEN